MFSLAMTEVIHKAVRETTSDVKTLSYIDDTVLVGPADDIAEILQTLPRAISDTGLSLQRQKTQLWALYGDQVTQNPILKHIQTQMKDPRGLIILGEALGEDPTDPYPMGNEAFIQDHLRDVTQAVANDLRKIAVLPDKLEGETAGLQVAWALISKTLPPRVVHLLRAHPVEQTQEMCDTLQDALLDTVRQLLGQPTITADQLHLAKLPVTRRRTRPPTPSHISAHSKSIMHCHPAPGRPYRLLQTRGRPFRLEGNSNVSWNASEASVKSTQHRWQVTSWTHHLALAYAT